MQHHADLGGWSARGRVGVERKEVSEMINHGEVGYEAHCDSCSEARDCPDAEYFSDAVTDLKLAGWKIEKRDGEWRHLCPDCHGAKADFGG